MPGVDAGTLVVVALAAFALVTASLYVLARASEDERQVAGLRREVTEVRRRYAQRLAEMSGRMVEEIDTAQRAVQEV